MTLFSVKCLATKKQNLASSCSSKDTGTSKHYINAKETHAILAAQCTERMKAGLRRDICDFRKLDMFRDKIDKQVIDTHIFLPISNMHACTEFTIYNKVKGFGKIKFTCSSTRIFFIG